MSLARERNSVNNMDENGMSLVGHLTELRRSLIISIAAILVCSLGSYVFSETIMEVLTRPVDRLVFLSPVEAFISHIKVSFFIGFLIALPIIVYQTWRFVLPALNQNEKKSIHILVPMSVLLFFVGLVFSFVLVVPVGIRFLLGYSTENIEAMISLGNYITFVMSMTLPFGIVFQLPLFQVVLIRLGIVTVQRMVSLRKYVVVGAFIVGAILTPPDVISQVMLAVPLLALYELGLIVGRIVTPRKDKEE
jgi:sec-independent protein translocase protein TatC